MPLGLMESQAARGAQAATLRPYMYVAAEEGKMRCVKKKKKRGAL